MEALRTENLSIGYKPDRYLARDMNISLQSGELVGLVGQNGVGKSTFVRTICGLQPQLSGKIFLEGSNLESLSPQAISKKISVVLTGKPDSLNLTVLELVALGRHPYSGWLGNLKESDKNVIEGAISRMEINYLAEKRLFELSDGQLQKVMIARALAQDTDMSIFLSPITEVIVERSDRLGRPED